MASIFKLLNLEESGDLYDSVVQVEYFDLVTETRKIHEDTIMYMTSLDNGVTIIHLVNAEIVLSNFAGVLVFTKIGEKIPNSVRELRLPMTRRITELKIREDIYHPNPDLDLYYFLKTSDLVGKKIKFHISSLLEGFDDEIVSVENIVTPKQRDAVRVSLRYWGELYVFESGRVRFYKRFNKKMDYYTAYVFRKVEIEDQKFYLGYQHSKVEKSISTLAKFYDVLCNEASEKCCVKNNDAGYEEFIENLFSEDNIDFLSETGADGKKFFSVYFHNEVLRVTFYGELNENIAEGLKLMKPSA